MALLGYQPIEYLDFFANRGYQVAIVNKNLEGIYTAASGSPKAHHVIKRNEFDTLIKEVRVAPTNPPSPSPDTAT